MFYWSRWFRYIRLLALVGFLLVVTLYTVHQLIYSRAWHSPLVVVIYPINGDGSKSTDRYIRALTDRSFKGIDDFMAREASRYKLLISRPTKTLLGPELTSLPPKLSADAGPLESLLWGLKVRWWAYDSTPDNDYSWNTVRMYVSYYSNEGLRTLDHSVGLQKGLMGIVNGFALVQQSKQNNIVIAHELLHTVGASDKYDQFLNPVFPEGYANPDRQPRYPQRSAEVMAGRIPISKYSSYMALSLKSVIIGEVTAEEINWVKNN